MFTTRKTAGVTLIEVNLAMGVLLFGVLAIASLFPSALNLADKGFQTSDATLIAKMAKAQLQIMVSSPAFEFPDAVEGKDREGRLNEGPKDNSRNLHRLACKELNSEALINWSRDWGSGGNGYMLMTSGGEAGKLYRIRRTSNGIVEFEEDVAGSNLHPNDSFRIIYNSSGTRCIPDTYYSRGDLIPTINGTCIDLIAAEENKLVKDVRDQVMNSGGSAANLAKDDQIKARYEYAILLDSPEKSSPELYRAYVLVYRDFDHDLQNWRFNEPAVDFYTFFYRRPPAAR